MSERENPDGEVTWPLRLTGEELAEMIDSLGLAVAATSPIARLTREAAGRAGPNTARTQPPPAVARALGVLAAPRQLLLVRLIAEGASAGDPQVLGFLNDGRLVVRFDVGSRGCMVAEPCEHHQFAQLVCSLAGVEVQSSSDERIVMTQKFLEAIVAFRLAGLFGSRDARIPIADAESAVTAVGYDTVRARDLLRALEADGLLTIDDSTVAARPEWLERYPFLAAPASVKVDATELGDVVARRTRTKRLAILGERPDRVVFLPPTGDKRGREVVLELAPATTPAVASAVEQLLAPPLAPPCSPVAECDGSPPEWLDGPTGDGATPEWHLQALEEIVAAIDDGIAIPDALLAPQVTIDVLSTARGGAGFDRTILALDATQAVEWTLNGSLVMWRALGPGDLRSRLDELIPITGHSGVTAATGELPAAAFEGLLARRVSATTSRSVPPNLQPLADDAETRWYRVRITHRVHGTSWEQTMLLADSIVGGAWRFELDGEMLTARTIDSTEIHSALASALATSTVAGAVDSIHIS